jgi:hypothetical protein
MKTITKNLVKNENIVFVVTRRGRRIEDKNYKTQAEALYRADCLYSTLKEWDPDDLNKIEIVKTSRPYKIF